ncbi:MAG: Na+/H+ antiporter NhaA [Candidatus Heimdallarchaeota archaeon]|nr:Na+/H+ antiporter NhaA [Candidatus Heimdallarchaeota archaeon]
MSDIPKRIYSTLKNPPIVRIVSPLQKFIQKEASGSRILLICVLIGLIWINLPFTDSYTNLWNIYIGFNVGTFDFHQTLLHWINDGLMAIFFFLIGLELKREMIVGGLNDLKEASFSIVAAIGGMVLPLLIYLIFNPPGSIGARGWGIPMSTDIAISLGILALFSYNVPKKLKLLLTSIAIIDDIGAILVIAIFYSNQINWLFLAISALILAVLYVFNRLGIRSNLVYIIPGIILWFFVFQSGIHATLTGILLAAIIPATKRIDVSEFHEITSKTLNNIAEIDLSEGDSLVYSRYKASIHALERGFTNIQTPLELLEHTLINWVVFLIVPLFGLANSGINFWSLSSESFSINVFLGIFFGLLIGKPLGMLTFAFLYSKTKFYSLHAKINWLQLLGIGFIAGIGFTMSNFIAGLAFSDDRSLLDTAKIGILLASIIAAISGYLILRYYIKLREKSSKEESQS